MSANKYIRYLLAGSLVIFLGGCKNKDIFSLDDGIIEVNSKNLVSTRALQLPAGITAVPNPNRMRNVNMSVPIDTTIQTASIAGYVGNASGVNSDGMYTGTGPWGPSAVPSAFPGVPPPDLLAGPLGPPGPPMPPLDNIDDFPVVTGPIYSLCGNGKLDKVTNTIACPELTPAPTFREVAVAPCVGFVYIEQCDDGNTFDNDGCSSVCMKECCGNGIVEQGEECDTGQDSGPDLPNISPPANFPIIPGAIGGGIPPDSDGFTNANQWFYRPFAACSNPAKLRDEGNCSRHCQFIICGDGVVNGLEQCDDGNDLPCDGCYRCALETPTTNNCCNCVPPLMR